MAKTSTRMGQERQLANYSNQAPQVLSGGQIPSVQFSTGRASALMDFSRTMFGIGGQLQDQLDQQAAAEAQKEGAIDGLAGKFEEQSYETIRGRAYNKSMLETFVTTLDTRSMIETARLQQMYGADPLKLETALNEYHKGQAEEVEKIAPGAGAAMIQRAASRTLPAVEAARDNRFKLTKEQAEASLIENEAAIIGSVKKNAGGMFSDNPAMSQASSRAVAQTVGEYMRTYDAVDDVTGKPLFSATDKAKARTYIRDKVMESGALSWFDSQPDKVAAFMKLSGVDAAFNVDIPGETPANVIYENKGKRNLPVAPDVMSKLQTVGGAMGQGVEVVITSGGQVSEQDQKLARARGETSGQRTGSVRHDHGNSADVMLRVNGKNVRPDQNPQLYHQFAEYAAAAGFEGIGHYGGWMHVGGGGISAWGANGRGDTLDPTYAAAIERGRKSGGLKLAAPINKKMALKEVMSEAAFNRMDAEMRQRISFENTLADRDRTETARKLKVDQDLAEFEVSTRIYSSGKTDPDSGQPIKEITVPEIMSLQREGILTPDKAAAFVKAIETEKPEKSDDTTYREIQRRMFNGEDVQNLILTSGDRLSKTDSASLLSNNRSMNVQGAGSLTNEQQAHYTMLKDVLTPRNDMGMNDPNREQRQYEALTEWRRRVNDMGKTGETLTDITDDIRARSTVDALLFTKSTIGSLILPRFSVQQAGEVDRRIDVKSSVAALQAKRSTMSEREFTAQVRLLRLWDEAQKQEQLDMANDAQTNKKKVKK